MFRTTAVVHLASRNPSLIETVGEALREFATDTGEDARVDAVEVHHAGTGAVFVCTLGYFEEPDLLATLRAAAKIPDWAGYDRAVVSLFSSRDYAPQVRSMDDEGCWTYLGRPRGLD